MVVTTEEAAPSSALEGAPRFIKDKIDVQITSVSGVMPMAVFLTRRLRGCPLLTLLYIKLKPILSSGITLAPVVHTCLSRIILRVELLLCAMS